MTTLSVKRTPSKLASTKSRGVGCVVGCIVGCDDGDDVGNDVGEDVGFNEGMSVGDTATKEAMKVGLPVGVTVGRKLEGDKVGTTGRAEGLHVGVLDIGV